jgi:hypothetical protein
MARNGETGNQTAITEQGLQEISPGCSSYGLGSVSAKGSHCVKQTLYRWGVCFFLGEWGAYVAQAPQRDDGTGVTRADSLRIRSVFVF